MFLVSWFTSSSMFCVLVVDFAGEGGVRLIRGHHANLVGIRQSQVQAGVDIIIADRVGLIAKTLGHGASASAG